MSSQDRSVTGRLDGIAAGNATRRGDPDAGLVHAARLQSGRLARTAAASIAGACQRLAFWLAIVLPFVALAVLASGVSTRSEQLVLGTVLVGNVVVLVAGKGHDPA